LQIELFGIVLAATMETVGCELTLEPFHQRHEIPDCENVDSHELAQFAQGVDL